ncbi:V-type ATPase 116kDa subunit family protein [Candidatus Bilamarchaeum dharawalense]|uniref:A-type ATP synthase subunit I n=1 Tax=Candidatus Bilamarchaeum dharawalense TaxID=2885759 RepID=A0A5E4LMA4_9ARCH|nr:V-type ATPase 116kDa subunit family protein [Candidatus Bilamarchaeum dharawalense]
MFKPKSMRKVRLIVLKSVVENLIKDLHEIGLVDIRKTKYEGLDSGRPLAAFDEVSGVLLELRAILNLMEASIGKRDGSEPKIIDGKKAIVMARSLKSEEQLRKLNQEVNELNERIKTLENESAVVNKVLHFKNIDFSGLSTRTIDYRVGEVPVAKLSKLMGALDKLGTNSNVINEKDSNIILILFEKKFAQIIDPILSDNGFNDIELPRDMVAPKNVIARIKTELDEKKARLKIVQKEMLEVSKANIQTVKSLIASLEVESDRAEIVSRFSSSKSLYVLEGWIIGSDLNKIETIVQKYGSKAHLEDVHFGHDETPPTVLDNPGLASPMEFVTKSYSMPNYFEIDPTMMYLVALPVLYGMIVGDVLYGVISALLALFLMKKFEKSYIMYNVSKIWLYSSIPTIFFGLVFDEWAGMTHFHFSEFIGDWTGVQLLHEPLYHGLARMENILILVGLSVAMGMIHLAIGFVLGALNEWNHNKKHAIAKIAWIGVELAIVLALGPQLGLLPQDFTIAGLVVLVLSVIIIGITEGIIGIIEVPGFTGNILSYSRIAAVGIAGVVIAELLNEFLRPLPTQGLLAIIMVPVFLVLHILNCFVAMFEALIQGGRLNIVEFRSKFLHGGGDVFIPFALYNKKL